LAITIVVIAAVLAALLFLNKKAVAGTKAIESGTLDAIIQENSIRFRVPEALIRAIIKVESDYNPYAVNPSDPSYGLMQVTPILAETYGYCRDHVNPTEAEIAMIMRPELNVMIGTKFLGELTSRHSLEESIQMYNVGEAGFNAGRRSPDYLEKVMRYYNEYATP